MSLNLEVGWDQDFNKLRDECLQRGVLFEDPEFPATDSSLYYSDKYLERYFDRYLEWKRPGEIVDNPRLYVDGFSRFDVKQGRLGNCWLSTAIANLALNRKLLLRVIPDGQGFQENYAGIFHFRFWQYGGWVDIVIDDRLPTYQGKLTFIRSPQSNEFWCALLEKAFAKLHGSYEALIGGFVHEGLEDFTGGVVELYDLRDPPTNLSKIMVKAYERESLMACFLEPFLDDKIDGEKKRQGLIPAHTYSITRVSYVDIKEFLFGIVASKPLLIRLRNPWGFKEWTGHWSDESPYWQLLSKPDREKLSLVVEDDGEFWVSFEDFQTYFDHLEICNLSPDSLTDKDTGTDKKTWELKMFDGEWKSGFTAGGCMYYEETFWCNPQYRLTLSQADDEDDEDGDDDDEGVCTVVVALMQKHRRVLQQEGKDNLRIGFVIFSLPNPEKLPKRLDMNFFNSNTPVESSAFADYREVSGRYWLRPGTYCIVPSTDHPDSDAEFLLRIFTEEKCDMEENVEKMRYQHKQDYTGRKVAAAPPE